jgi:hypothetical protein
MPKDLYQSKKIVTGLGMNYVKIDVYEKNYMLSGGSTRTIPNICIVVGPDT